MSYTVTGVNALAGELFRHLTAKSSMLSKEEDMGLRIEEYITNSETCEFYIEKLTNGNIRFYFDYPLSQAEFDFVANKELDELVELFGEYICQGIKRLVMKYATPIDSVEHIEFEHVNVTNSLSIPIYITIK